MVHVSQGNRMESDLALFEVLQKPRDVETVILEGFHKRTRIHRGANPNVRRALYLPAVTASCMGNNGLARTYQRLVEKNGLCK